MYFLVAFKYQKNSQIYLNNKNAKMETPGSKRKLIKMNSDDQLSPDSLKI